MEFSLQLFEITVLNC